MSQIDIKIKPSNKDDILRTLEFNFWQYQYCCRKFWIEVVQGCNFDKDSNVDIEHVELFNSSNEIIPQIISLKFIEFCAAITLFGGNNTTTDTIAPFALSSTDQALVRQYLRSWHNYLCLSNENIFESLHLFVIEKHNDFGFLKLVNSFPQEVKDILDYLHKCALKYKYFPYTLGSFPRAKKILDDLKLPKKSELEFKELYKNQFSDYLLNNKRVEMSELFFRKVLDPQIKVVYIEKQSSSQFKLSPDLDMLHSQSVQSTKTNFFQLFDLLEQSFTIEISKLKKIITQDDIVLSVKTTEATPIDKLSKAIKKIFNLLRPSNDCKSTHFIISESGELIHNTTINWDVCTNSNLIFALNPSEAKFNYNYTQTLIKKICISHMIIMYPNAPVHASPDAFNYISWFLPKKGFQRYNFRRLIGLYIWDSIHLGHSSSQLPLKILSGIALRRGTPGLTEQEYEDHVKKFISQLKKEKNANPALAMKSLTKYFQKLSIMEPAVNDDRDMRRAYESTCKAIAAGEVLNMTPKLK